jgi:hypothetical protein
MPQLPAACADCVTTLQPAVPGAPTQQVAHRLSRAGDGKMRVDYGNTSVITDPVKEQLTLIDHVAKEVRVIPIPKPEAPKTPELPKASIPGMPAAPAAPPPPEMIVKELGKRVVDGIEVEGRQYMLPKPPEPPKPPSAPNAPKLPGAPAIPETPPTITEVWTSPALQVAILTRITGPFGKQTCHCKNAVAGEPDPALFQIPAGYKKV